MTTANAPSLYDTGQAGILLDALTAVLLHQRLHHPGYRGAEHRRTFQCHGDLCGDLMDLAHNWPAVVSGQNRAFSATFIAGQIEGFLSKYALDGEFEDRGLRDGLRFAVQRLNALEPVPGSVTS